MWVHYRICEFGEGLNGATGAKSAPALDHLWDLIGTFWPWGCRAWEASEFGIMFMM